MVGSPFKNMRNLSSNIHFDNVLSLNQTHGPNKLTHNEFKIQNQFKTRRKSNGSSYHTKIDGRSSMTIKSQEPILMIKKSLINKHQNNHMQISLPLTSQIFQNQGIIDMAENKEKPIRNLIFTNID